MRSYSTKVGPDPMTGVLIKKKNQRYRKNTMSERCFHQELREAWNRVPLEPSERARLR